MIAAVIVAGAVGAVLRYLVSRVFASNRSLSSRAAAYRNVPWAVLIVNVVGSAIGGAVLGLATTGVVSSDLRLVLLTGLCGGLTTFSTFSVETVQLVLERRYRQAALSVGLNLVLGIAAAALGYLLVS